MHHAPPAPTTAERVGRLGDRVADWWRDVRYRVTPRARRTYAELVGRGHDAADPRPIAACDFRTPQVDAMGGRYLYNVLHHVVGAGYLPAYRRNYRFLAGMGLRRFKRRLLDLPLCTYDEESSLPGPALLVTDSPEAAENSHAERVVLLDFADRRAEEDEIPLCFGMHPAVAAQSLTAVEAELDAPRPNRVYFAGNVKQGQYDARVIRERYGLTTRIELVDQIRKSDALPRPFVLSATDGVGRLGEGHAIALVVDHSARLTHADWLPAMRQADFFLACPGTRHPMCHNLIEALAVGTVPIVEYARYTDPALEDGVNCLTFRGADDAVNAVRRALAMPEDERRRLRRGAREFYLRHHAPGRLIETIKAAPSRRVTLLMNEHRAPRAEDPSIFSVEAARPAAAPPSNERRRLAA